MRNIQLRRDGRLVSTLDLYRFINEGDKSADARLMPGDVIVIPPAGPRVAVTGAVERICEDGGIRARLVAAVRDCARAVSRDLGGGRF